MYPNQSYASPSYAPGAGYYGNDAAAPAAPATESSAGMLDKVKGWAALAHSSDLVAFLASAGTAVWSYFQSGSILGALAWGAVAWGGYRIATALIAGEGLGTEPVFSLGLMGAGGAFLLAQSAGAFNLFDEDFTEEWDWA